MLRRVLMCAAVIALAGVGRAGAAVLFTDNFDSETVGSAGWVMNDASLANFDVIAGSVDLLAFNGPFHLPGVGNFVDLDGTTGHGGTLQTISQFNYDAGQTVTLDVLVAGNHRRGADNLIAGFSFSNPIDVTNVSLTGFSNFSTAGDELLGTASLASDAAYQDYTISFTALSAGSLRARVGTDSMDNIGPLLDSLTLSDLSSVVPEPATWSLMVLGLGGLGAMLRRRRAAAPTFA